jgi:acetate kinase
MPRDAILVVNAGSSSVKFALYARDALVLHGSIDGIASDGSAPAAPPTLSLAGCGGHETASNGLTQHATDHEGAVACIVELVQDRRDMRLVAAGHRVVHGGMRYSQPVRITPAVLADLAALVPLAPLHQPHGLAAIRALAAAMPQLPQVACFDTQFHHTQPQVAQAIALPAALTDAGLRRYGFHGLSYEYVAQALRSIDAPAAAGRVVVAHLGNGASMCAMLDGRSIATTMGFTTLDGLVMGTRAGSLDPGVLLYLQAEHGYALPALTRLLYQEAGLLGVSGIASDMRTLLESDDPRAARAVELFCYRCTRELGSLAAALGGLDALVFTGGIGEHAAPVRARVVDAARWLGLVLDDAANAGHAARITTASSRVPAYVVPADEARVILQHTQAALQADPPPE